MLTSKTNWQQIRTRAHQRLKLGALDNSRLNKPHRRLRTRARVCACLVISLVSWDVTIPRISSIILLDRMPFMRWICGWCLWARAHTRRCDHSSSLPHKTSKLGISNAMYNNLWALWLSTHNIYLLKRQFYAYSTAVNTLDLRTTFQSSQNYWNKKKSISFAGKQILVFDKLFERHLITALCTLSNTQRVRFYDRCMKNQFNWRKF